MVDVVQAVQQSRAFKPELVLLDMMLPGGGGLKVLERFKVLTHTAQVPVIVLTGMQNEQRKREVLAQGVAAYFEKPYDWEDLLEKIQELVGEEA